MELSPYKLFISNMKLDFFKPSMDIALLVILEQEIINNALIRSSAYVSLFTKSPNCFAWFVNAVHSCKFIV